MQAGQLHLVKPYKVALSDTKALRKKYDTILDARCPLPRNEAVGMAPLLGITSNTPVSLSPPGFVQVPRSADGRFVGPLPLRPPLRWWESGGADLCPRRVHSRVGFLGGVGEVVAAAALRNILLG